jgi:hypothetical protein
MSVVTLEVSESQIVAWVLQLSPATRQSVLRALIPRLDGLNELMDYGSQQIRTLCAERGRDWDSLGEDERERLIDELVHEDEA